MPQQRNDSRQADDEATRVELRADGEPVTEAAGTEAGWAGRAANPSPG